MSDLKEKRVDLILQQLEELPTLPAVALRVLEVTREDAASARQIAELISNDPSLSARILQLVRRADVGVRGEVHSVERAVVLLGFDAVRSAVLAVSVFQTFPPSPTSNGASSSGTPFNREAFWKHCLAVACCAELLADECGDGPEYREFQASAFLCGLLHDLGKIALDTILPKSFSRVVEAVDLLRGNIAEIERNVIGLDHLIAGKRLAEKWQLPPAVRDCIWLHGQLPEALPATVPEPRLVNLVTLADTLVREQHLGYSGNYTFTVPRAKLLNAVGLDEAAVQRAMQRLVEHMEPRAIALGLDQVSSGELYRQALAQANKELGRIGNQLVSKNRKLAVRAKFFDALTGFQSELRPDAATQTVLSAIAQTAVSVLGVEVAAAFSLPPARSYAETILCDSRGTIIQTSLIDAPTNSSSTPADHGKATDESAAETATPMQAPGDGPVLTAGQGLEWFLTAVSPRLPHDRRFWICLQADSGCIGGVVWGATAGESNRLSAQVQELSTIAAGWALALRMAQIREEARTLAEQLAETNRRLLDAQTEILRSRMMITVGEMAAGAAHEMNNPLAVISGRSQLLAAQLADPKHKAAAHLIHEQSHRLSAIITELMDFAKPEAPSLQQCDAADLIGRALHNAKLNNDPADRTIELTMGDVPPVNVDADQVAGALTEIIDNAIHATDPASGVVAVHAAHDVYSRRLVITVTDNGAGMDEDTVKRAFDPFFSNKPAGRRRGLGLAKALRWVEASGGSIRLESHAEQGTRAIVLLPASDGQQTAAPVDRRKAENF